MASLGLLLLPAVLLANVDLAILAFGYFSSGGLGRTRAALGLLPLLQFAFVVIYWDVVTETNLDLTFHPWWVAYLALVVLTTIYCVRSLLKKAI